MLEVDELHVSYGPIAAVHGVSLTVATGETVALVGANGAGKSTTLLAIVGVLTPRSGTVRFEGRDIQGQKPESIVPLGISLVPEARQIFGGLTVEENLRIGATTRRDKAEVAASLAYVLDLFPMLGDYLARPANGLSGGQQQMLALGRALMSKPTLLLLDEPSLGLAPVVVDAVFEAIRQMQQDGVSILLVEQNAARALEVATRVYALRTGEVHLAGPADELSRSGDFEALYLGGL